MKSNYSCPELRSLAHTPAGFTVLAQAVTLQPWTRNNLPSGRKRPFDAGAPFPGTGGVLSTNLCLGPEPSQFCRFPIEN
jgi:hypothetical protein